MMPLWLDLLRTPMAAPETRSLRRMRLTWQGLCLGTAVAAGSFSPLHHLLGDRATLGVGMLLAAVIAHGALYFACKHRADSAYLADLAEPLP